MKGWPGSVFVWRGPFRVERAGPQTWKIVNAAGETERIGFTSHVTADAFTRILNTSRDFCNVVGECECCGEPAGEGGALCSACAESR